ncbi:hypothetical protein SG34_032945 [Thalassomonas viridans]|uniref:Uncharacterized protein n=1 Tax=Thalassomonas viridans TaxID=137584 RepID=A0AAF0CEE6_9GAMM|nr:hypothetical protein [Thalassomonas viridans]WDE08714.1 hypothetical protein SG34_032945 [Thalassomonas viridans]
MTTEEVRRIFEELIGREKYEKFISALHNPSRTRGRMKFWQEKLWNQFCSETGYPETSYEDITKLFDYCLIHNQEFRADIVPVVYGTFEQEPKEKQFIKDNNFPYAALQVKRGGPAEAETETTVKYCIECRKAYKSVWPTLCSNTAVITEKF